MHTHCVLYVSIVTSLITEFPTNSITTIETTMATIMEERTTTTTPPPTTNDPLLTVSAVVSTSSSLRAGQNHVLVVMCKLTLTLIIVQLLF